MNSQSYLAVSTIQELWKSKLKIIFSTLKASFVLALEDNEKQHGKIIRVHIIKGEFFQSNIFDKR